MLGYRDKSSNKRKFIFNLLFVLSISLLLLTFLIVSICLSKDPKIIVLKSIKSAITSVFYKFNDKNLEHLKLYVSPMHMEKLKIKRENAYTKGAILITEDTDEVPAYLSVNNSEPIKVNIRLKGDWVDHLEDDKWSFRVKVKKNLAVLGMRVFSLQKNETRGGHGEALLLSDLRKNGALAPRYFYATLELNNRHLGIYALEEHFSKELLENQQRRESPILALDEDMLWRQRKFTAITGKNPLVNPNWTLDNHLSTNNIFFKTFRESKVWKSESLTNHYKQALGLMRGYKEGFIPFNDVFDAELVGKYIAVINLWDSNHGLYRHNLRFYYNPITRLFEPIGFDNEVFNDPVAEEDQEVHNAGFYKPFADSEFLESYNKTLLNFEEEINKGAYKQEINNLEQEIMDYLKFENPDYKSFPPEKLAKRLNFLKNNPITSSGKNYFKMQSKTAKLVEKPLLVTFLNVFCVQDKNENYLEFQNITDRDVKIDEIYFLAGKKKVKIDIPAKYRTIPPNLSYKQRLRLAVDNFPEDKKESYQVIATFDENNYRKEIKAVKYFPAFEKAKYGSDEVSEFLSKFPFIELKDNKSFVIKTGNWKINEDILVPEDYSLIIEKGAKLDFAPGKRLVSRGAVFAQGEKEQPIIFTGDNWKGISVLKAVNKSILQHVKVENVNISLKDDWYLTGAVTFYESDVDIKSCDFQNNLTEDSLNIIRSSFKIDDTAFRNSYSDAIDVDFGKGEINNSIFENINADAVDISGSQVKASNLKMINIQDKGVSVGEKSDFEGTNININNANIAIASKDSSIAVLKESNLRNINDTVYMSYIKKNEYGESLLKVFNNNVSEYKRLSGSVYPCSIQIDGKKQNYQEINVKKLYENNF